MGISTETLVCEDMTLCTDPSNSYYTVHGWPRETRLFESGQNLSITAKCCHGNFQNGAV